MEIVYTILLSGDPDCMELWFGLQNNKVMHIYYKKASCGLFPFFKVLLQKTFQNGKQELKPATWLKIDLQSSV